MERSIEAAALRVRWGRVFAAGILPPILIHTATILAPGIFSGVLGFLAMSAAALWLTVLAGAWVANGVGARSAALHGLLVGFVVAAFGPAFGILGPSSVTLAALVVLAGWTGGILGGKA